MKSILFLISLLLLITSPSISQTPRLELPKGASENYFLTSDSVRLNYVTAGKGDALIFIPGWTMPAEIWEFQIEYFSKTNLVIALDVRGHGKSEKTSDGHYLFRQSKDVQELINHLKLPSYYLIGWSWGGFIIYDYLKNFNSPALKGVVVVDSPFEVDSSFRNRMATRIKGLLEKREETTLAFVKSLFKQPHPEYYLKKLAEASMKMTTTSAVTLLANLFFQDGSEWIATIRSITTPALFVGAEGREKVYQDFNQTVKINFVIVPGAGHTVFVDKPVEFNKILEKFVKGQ